MKYVVCGDFNINTLLNNAKVSEYIAALNSIGCNQMVDVPTRFANNCKSSLLDHLYTNITKETHCGVCQYEVSDHLPTFFIVQKFKCCLINKQRLIRCMKNFNLENFLTRKEKRLSEKPWITKGILVSIKMKNKLFRACFKSNNADKKPFYKKYRNKLSHIKYHAKRNYYENLVKSNNRNPSQKWSAIKEIIECKKSSKKSKLPSALLIENQMINTDSHVFLDKLWEYFANIGTNLANNIPQTNNNSFKIFTNSCVQSFALQEICEEDVISCINNVKSDAAPGSDEIPSKFIKLSKCILAPLLSKLFNKCIKQEIFPDPFKLAYVIPIPKVSNPKSLDDLRPISLLPVFAKIFEKILERNVTKFLNKNDIITPSQFGFRINSSTELAVTTLYDKLLNNLNENKVTLSLFLDLRKAFDSVNHQLLLKKLTVSDFADQFLPYYNRTSAIEGFAPS